MRRRKGVLLILFFLALSSLLFAQEGKKRAMTVDDVLNMVRVGNPQLSPDGKWILFTKTTLNWEKNKWVSKLFMIPATGGEAFQYTAEEGDRSPQWSPDGKYIAFLRRGKGKKKYSQIWLIRTTGGEAFQLTKHKASIISFKWTKDGKKIVFLSPDPVDPEVEKKMKQGDDVIYVDEGPNGQYRGSWSNLWVVDVKTKEIKPITKEKMRVQGFDVSPKGDKIVFVRRLENHRNEMYRAEICIVDIKGGKITQLTHNQAPEMGVSFSPDGEHIAYLAPDDKTWKLANDKIWLLNINTGKYRMLSGRFEGNISWYRFSPDGSKVFFNGLQCTASNLYELDVASGRIRKLTNFTGVARIASMTPDGKRFAYTYSDYKTPPDIWVADLPSAKPIRITDANPWIRKEIALADMKIIHWKSKDGLKIEGLLYLPAGKKGKLPLILNVHGGPAGVFTNRFNGEYQVYTGLGYAMLCPNVRGSSGYTDKFLRGNMHDIGGGDYWDLMTGVDYVIKKGIADPDKLGIRGWSYGGILSGWTITKTNRFKAASLGAMVCDWRSEYGQGFNYDVKLWYIGGTPWDNPDGYLKHSSYTYIKNVKTPSIIFHGERDITDTIQQSMNYHNALRELGVPVRFIRFPREPHGIREPHHRRILMVEEIAWMQKYIRGIKWTAPPREKEKEKKEKKEEE